MANFRYFTVADAMQHLQDFAGSSQKASEKRRRRLAIAAAYQHLTTLRPWRYYVRQDRLDIAAPYDTGTISYDHTGGSSERLVTLNGGTFPSWTGRGTLVPASGVEYEIDERLDDTTATLTETSNPGSDFSSTAYTLYNDRHLVPMEMLGVDKFFAQGDRQELVWTDARDFLQQRQRARTADRPSYYTMLGDSDAMGRMTIRIAPFPSAAIALDFSYQRKARQLLFDEYKAGTITTAGTTAVTGTSTSFQSPMDGAILRVSYATAETDEDNGDSDPQWFEAMALPVPFLYERRITAVGSTTSLTVDSSITTLTGVRYSISDPIDVEPGAMFTAFLRCCEWQLGCLMRWPDRDQLLQQYQAALQAAVEVDNNYNLRMTIDPPPVNEVSRREQMPITTGR